MHNGRRIGVIGLAEAGNLGDDLILISVVRSLGRVDDVREVAYLGHRMGLNWDAIEERVGALPKLSARPPGRDFPFSRRERSLFADCDGVVFGGGGLLQDVHHPERPYHWLRYLPEGIPSIAVGLGIGPLTATWRGRLEALPNPLGEVFVRDEGSQSLADSFGWNPMLSADCVSKDLVLALVGSDEHESTDDRSLGVALRSWPGLDAEMAAAHIDAIRQKSGCTDVIAFVLEAKSGVGPDVEFTRDVMARVSSRNTIHVYDGDNLLDLMRAMAKCHSAISMKLHSSVLWGYFGVQIYPITYAPKTSALFGLPWQGLEVLDTPMIPIEPAGSAPSSDEVIRNWLLQTRQSVGVPVPVGLRLRCQSRTTVGSVARRVGQLVKRS